MDDETADNQVDTRNAETGKLADPAAATAASRPPRTKIELPEMTRRVPIQAPKYNPPPRMESGLLYEVGDSRIYLEGTVLKPLEKALKDLSLARPQSAAHYLGEVAIVERKRVSFLFRVSSCSDCSRRACMQATTWLVMKLEKRRS